MTSKGFRDPSDATNTVHAGVGHLDHDARRKLIPAVSISRDYGVTDGKPGAYWWPITCEDCLAGEPTP